MKTDIAILSNGNDGLIYRCLLSISNQIDKQDLGIVALSWNGDKDELDNVKKYAGDLPNINLKILEEPYHFSKNNNKLVKEVCRSEYVLFLNDDIQLMDNFAHKAMELIKDNSDVGFVGSKLIRPDNTVQHAGVIALVDMSGNLVGPAHYLYNHKDQYTPDFTPLAVTGACMMCRRETFLELGGFNEQYDEGFQDFEICVKAVCANLSNVCLNTCSQLHEESATRDPKVLLHDSDILAAFWRYHISELMKSSSPSCRGIIERK